LAGFVEEVGMIFEGGKRQAVQYLRKNIEKFMRGHANYKGTKIFFI